VDTYPLVPEVFIMQRHRPPYPAEFRAQMIDLGDRSVDLVDTVSTNSFDRGIDR
jgi:hypothetical protein